MIPNFETPSGNLPMGMHWATWDEITIRYGINPTRRKQLKGLKAAADELKRCGCTTLLLNGSFVTNKRLPGDFDALWVFDSVNLAILDPVLKDVKPPRKAQNPNIWENYYPFRIFSYKIILAWLNISRLTGATIQKE